MSKYRILYVEKPTSVGGSVISLYELVRGLNTDLYEPVVLFYGPNPYRDRFQALGVQVIALSEQAPQALPEAAPARDIAASLNRYSGLLANGYRATKQAYLMMRQERPLAQRVARIIKDEAIDLVHHNGSLPRNRATISAARLANRPQVCHVRMLHEFSFFERYLARFVNRFIYISKAVEQLYRDLGLSTDKGEVIYNPIDVKAFAQANHSTALRAEFGFTEQDYVVSNIGRLDWWKGQDDFLRALTMITQMHPNTKALIVGKPDTTTQSQAYYQELQRLVSEWHLSEHVVFTGFRSDISSIMAVSDIVVHSASEPEPFGRVVVEGMAAGRPVIATGAGGVLDIIEDQVTGLLVPPKNAEAMAEAIGQLLQNRRQAMALGQKAQQAVRERFSVKQHVMAVERIYHQILSLEEKSL